MTHTQKKVKLFFTAHQLTRSQASANSGKTQVFPDVSRRKVKIPVVAEARNNRAFLHPPAAQSYDAADVRTVTGWSRSGYGPARTKQSTKTSTSGPEYKFVDIYTR